MSKILILSGKQGSGKTTLQKAMAIKWQENTGYRAITVNFADILYEMHDKVLQTLNRYWPDRGLKKDGPLLQLLGTEWGRNTISSDIWATCLSEKVRQLELENAHYANLLFIIGDCRFKNEFHIFENAFRVRLICDESKRKERCSMWRQDTKHASEIDLDEYEQMGLFDLVLDTGIIPEKDCLTTLANELERNKWLEYRE